MAAPNLFAPPGLASQFQNLYYSPGTPSNTATYGANPQFSLNPTARAGQGAFGAVPGAIGLPSPYRDLSGVFPNLSGTNAAVSRDILSKLSGTLSPQTQAAIHDAGAAWGLSSGVPGSGIQENRTLRDIGLTSEQQQQQGLQDYASLVPVISGTQTVSPNLQTEIAATNAQFAAAPDPTQAASYAKTLFDEYLRMLQGGGGGGGRGPAGGTGVGVSARQGAAFDRPFSDVGTEMAPPNYNRLLSGAF